jgi:hypothetical protein
MPLDPAGLALFHKSVSPFGCKPVVPAAGWQRESILPPWVREIPAQPSATAETELASGGPERETAPVLKIDPPAPENAA